MNKNIKIVIGVLVVALLVGGGFLLGKKEGKNEEVVEKEVPQDEEVIEEDKEEGIEDKKEEGNQLALDEKILDFKLNNLDGEEVSLSDYEGKIVLVNFWATWCQWCDKEMPDLQRLQDENDDLVVLAVNVRETEDEVRSYIEEGGYTFPVVLDESGLVAEDYLVSAFPSSYFVDKEGIFRGRVPSMLTYEDMDLIISDIRDN